MPGKRGTSFIIGISPTHIHTYIHNQQICNGGLDTCTLWYYPQQEKGKTKKKVHNHVANSPMT